MKYGEITWSEEKNRILRETRGVSFEDAEAAIELGNILNDVPHPLPDKYPNQRILVLMIDGYAFHVPYVFNEDGIFLKTMYASRKSSKIYLNRTDDD